MNKFYNRIKNILMLKQSKSIHKFINNNSLNNHINNMNYQTMID